MQPAKTKVLSHRVLYNHFVYENSNPLLDVQASFRLEFNKKYENVPIRFDEFFGEKIKILKVRFSLKTPYLKLDGTLCTVEMDIRPLKLDYAEPCVAVLKGVVLLRCARRTQPKCIKRIFIIGQSGFRSITSVQL